MTWIICKNVAIVAKSAEDNSDRFPELARKLARLNVNAMLVGGDQGLRAAKDATATIPIIVLACDPLDSLVVSIARPGGKATSMTCISSELAVAQGTRAIAGTRCSLVQSGGSQQGVRVQAKSGSSKSP